jgi:hypothetical protein
MEIEEWWASWFVGLLFTKHYFDDQIKEYVMGMTCSTYGGHVENFAQSLKGRRRCRLEDNIKMDLEEIRCNGVDWIQLTENRDQWRAVVNSAVNRWVQ